MKIFVLLYFICVIKFQVFAQEKFDPVSWKPPYNLSLEGWGIERFPIPIDFAPKVPYKGVEDVRFTTGWSKPQSDEYWSYAFLWYIEGVQTIDSKVIENNLSMYFDGLVNRNIEKRVLPKDLIKRTKVHFRKLSTPEAADELTFTGTIEMVDYMSKKAMVLQSKVHLKRCSGSNYTIIFHQFSPQKRNSAVWTKLNELWNNFRCTQ